MTFNADFSGNIRQGGLSSGISLSDKVDTLAGVKGVYYIDDGGFGGYRFSQDDSSIVWSKSDPPFRSTMYPDMEDGVLYFSHGGSDSALYGLNFESGNTKVSYTLSDYIQESAAVKDGIAYLGFRDSNFNQFIRAYDIDNDTVKWTDGINSEADLEKAVVDGSLYFGDSTGMFYSYDIDTGNRNWETSLDNDPRGPIVIGGTVYVTNGDDNLASIDPSDGSINWKSNTYDEVLPPIYVDKKLITGTEDSDVYVAININDGSEAWTYSVTEPLTVPAVYDGYAYCANENGDVFKLDISDGTEDWRVSASGSPQFGDTNQSPNFVAIQNDLMYIGGGGNQPSVYVFDISDGSEVRNIDASNSNDFSEGGVLIDKSQFSYHKAPGRFSDPGE